VSLLNYRASHKTNIEGILNNLLHQTPISLQYRLIPELNSCAWGMHCRCSSLLAGCRASSSGLRLHVLSHGQGVPHKSRYNNVCEPARWTPCHQKSCHARREKVERALTLSPAETQSTRGKNSLAAGCRLGPSWESPFCSSCSRMQAGSKLNY